MNRIDWHFVTDSGTEVIANSLGRTVPTTICGDQQTLYRSPVGSIDGLNNSPGVCTNGRFNMQIKIPTPITRGHVLFMCISGYNVNGEYFMSGSSLNISLEP
jgi:hypothetical protein